MSIFHKFYKSLSASILTLVLAVDATVYAQPARTPPQSYPMTCRGGGTLSIRNNNGNSILIRFQPAAGAATQGLYPGQCTWSDRALRSGEPTTICDNSANASQYVGLLVQSNQYAILQVYNDGNGCMRVFRVGP